jgi:nucleoside 2-deoxyribosyltransferase
MPEPRKIYLASSWRNPAQPETVIWLRSLGHEVYDFRNPATNDSGFSWREIDPYWLHWSAAQYLVALTSEEAKRGYAFDKNALDWCDTCILLLPCGRSAHLEAGYAIGQGKPTYIVLDDTFEPELMYLLGARIVAHREDLGRELALV